MIARHSSTLRTLRRLAALLIGLPLAGCDALDSLVNSALVTSVTVSPDTATLSVGESLRLSAVLADGADEPLLRTPLWRSLDPGVATVDTAGRVQGVSVGLATVEATADGRSDAARIRVVPLVDALGLTPDSLTLSEGESLQLGLSLRDRHGAPVTGVAVRWSSTEPSVATVDADGRVRALRAGGARIVAESGGAADTALVRVVPLVSRVHVSPDTLTLGQTESLQLGVTLADRDGNPLAGVSPEWRSSEPAVATVDAGGRVTARAVGVTRIVASVGLAADTATLRVVPRIASLGISPDTATLSVGESLQLGATLRDRSGFPLPEAPAWKSVEPGVATVDASGRVTARAVGVARIVASAGQAADTARIRVVPRAASVTVTPGSATLDVGESVDLDATVRDRFGATLPNEDPEWRSTDPGVATVTSAGRVRGVASGTARIIAQVGTVADTAVVSVVSGSSGALLPALRRPPGRAREP